MPGADQKTVEVLAAHGISDIQDFITAKEEGKLAGMEDLSQQSIDKIGALIDQTVEFVEDENAAGSENSETAAGASENESAETEAAPSGETDEEVYECPECGAPITIDMTVCPNCGVGLSFEYEDEE